MSHRTRLSVRRFKANLCRRLFAPDTVRLAHELDMYYAGVSAMGMSAEDATATVDYDMEVSAQTGADWSSTMRRAWQRAVDQLIREKRDARSEKTPAEERAFLIYYARVLLREARARRDRHRGYALTLIDWAGRSRRDAAAIDVSPAQGDLFGGAHG